MLVPLLLTYEPAPARQPTMIEAVGYQRVQRALPDGRPDPKAADNFYIRTRTRWFLMADSDALPVGKDGLRHVRVSAHRSVQYQRADERGDFKGLADRFTELGPVYWRERGKYRKTGSTDLDEFETAVSASQRLLVFHIHTTVEKVESHSVEGRRAVRTLRNAFWSVNSQGWERGKPFVPPTRPLAQFEPGFGVQAGPPKLGFGRFRLPGDKSF